MKNKKLVSLDIYVMHHAEFGQFIDRFINDFSEANLDLNTDTDFKTIFERLKAKTPAYNKALMQIRENENTKKIAELDKERDNDFQVLKNMFGILQNELEIIKTDLSLKNGK